MSRPQKSSWSRLNNAQLETLFEFLKENPSIAKGRTLNSMVKADTKRKWTAVSAHLNSLGSVSKTGVEWAKYWAERKCGLKKRYITLNAAMKHASTVETEGLPTLSPLEQRMLDLIGIQRIPTGEATPALDPISNSKKVRPNYAQQEALFKFLEENPSIIWNQCSTIMAKADTKRKWTAISSHLNSLGGVTKDGAGWAKYWAEKKCSLKKLYAARIGAIKHTNAVPTALQTLSPLERRMIDLIEKQGVAIGDKSCALDSFSNSNISQVVVESPEVYPPSPEVCPASPEVCFASPEMSPIPPEVCFASPVTPDEIQTVKIESSECSLSTALSEPSPQASPNRKCEQPLPSQSPHSTIPNTRVNLEPDLMAEIGACRVDVITANAFSGVCTQLERIAAAQETFAKSIDKMSDAIVLLATAILTNKNDDKSQL